jgi:predicted PurR-regulated permease PerM
MAHQQAPDTKGRFIPRPVQIVTLIAIVGGLYFISNYLGVILFSGLITLIFNPVYKWLLRKLKYQGLAIAAALVTIALSVIIPISVIMLLSVSQVTAMIADVSQSGVDFGPAHVQEVVDRGADRLNQFTEKLPGAEKIEIDQAKIADAAQSVVTDVLQYLANSLKSLGAAAFGLITAGILSVFLIIALFAYQDDLIRLLKRLSPYDDEIMNLYFGRTVTMTKAMVKGQFLIAIVQGLASAFSLWLVGIDYFWFFLMLLTFLSFIPLGAGVVTIPIGVVMILTGHVAQGIFIIAYHLTVVSFIDNILRPHLVPKDAKLNTAVMLLAVFSGIACFGPLGVVYGPVIVILILTTLHMYADFNDRTTRIHRPKQMTAAETV